MKETITKTKLKDLSELDELGLCIIEDEEETVYNKLQEILKEKGLIISDLSKLTGISRQNINAVIRGKMKPSIEFVLKVSYVLGIKEVDGIFSLDESAWVKPYRQERDATVYVNLIDMTMVDTKQKRAEIKESGHEYYHVKSKKLISKEERDELLREHLTENLDERIKSIKRLDPKQSVNLTKSKATEELKDEFNATYSRIYKKIGRRMEPYIVK